MIKDIFGRDGIEKMKERILKLLLESEDFISGEEMSQKLFVSRTTIWKQMNKLREEGYSIKSVTNKGYKLSITPDKFLAEDLDWQLKDLQLFDQVFVYETIDSTNKEAKRKAMESGTTTALILSEEQTAGRGRRGKQWVSKAGDGIYMSLLLRPKIKPQNASMLTLIAGLAVQRGILAITGLDTRIKWPNDLVIDHKKVCGILTEMSSEMDEVHHVVIGIGINVNNEDFDDTITHMATSLSSVGEQKYDRKAVVVEIMKVFRQLYTVFITEESLDFILEAYQSVCTNIGKMVKIEQNGQVIKAKAVAVTATGGLSILTEAGQEQVITSGEVSVRGLYGYVD